MGDTLRIEGFDTDLRGHRVLVIGNPEEWLARMTILESECLYKGRSILVIQETGKVTGTSGSNPLLLRKRWDLIVRIKDGFEAQMLATYVANCPKPARILWCFSQGQEIPRALWQKWVKTDVTLIGGSDGSSLGACEWESILFPHGAENSLIERVINGRTTGAMYMFSKIKDNLSDLKESGAALAWTMIEEKNGGQFYWYDPEEGVRTEDAFTKKEAGELLESIGKWIKET